jgi:hypothetical protein
MLKKRTVTFIFILLAVLGCNSGREARVRQAWTPERANEWYTHKGWLRGCDFISSTAINQLEMWQAETFDTVTIDRELGWAESIGLNVMRVYLHHVAWEVDPEGFKNRMDQYLSIADRNGIVTLFVLFDDCWNPTYQAGKQPDPKPGVHNSGWVRDPGDLIHSDTSLVVILEKYVKDVLGRFAQDKRIVLWDLYNEPGNSGYGNRSLPLLKKVFRWAREVNPSQPLSAGVWNSSLTEFNAFQLANSDVITYHNYQNDTLHKQCIDTLRKYGKPLLCTEYMARKHRSRFDNIMPMLKKENIAAINWGLVEGKTNTKYAWDEPIPDGSEPRVWFHEIFRKDGTPYRPDEVKLIRSLTGK